MSEQIFRTRKTRNFTTVANEFICDPRLSAKAKGILLYLLSKPDDWETKLVDIVNHMADGLDSIRSGIKELKNRGHIIQRSVRDEKGRITHWEFTVFEIPFEVLS